MLFIGKHLPAHPPVPHHPKGGDYGPPSCAKNHTQTFCVEDYEYPAYEIQVCLHGLVYTIVLLLTLTLFTACCGVPLRRRGSFVQGRFGEYRKLS